MLKAVAVKLEDIYIPAARRKELDQGKVDEIVEAMLNDDEQKPVKIREGKGRYVLVAGIHRLEACKAVGENTIDAYIVQAPKF
ncbi:MAG: ParB N-terminal domain-containing protein [Kordiimonadaceae bacterium]|nr:ParB N-terminal domain-containing protein [Kordiimonadaceae bacterium]